MASRSSVTSFFRRVSSFTGGGGGAHPKETQQHAKDKDKAKGQHPPAATTTPQQPDAAAATTPTPPLPRPPSFFKQKASEAGHDPQAASTATELPPALSQKGEVALAGRPPAASIGGAVIERYWALSDVLEDGDIALTWRLRVMMCHDAAKALKKLHDGDIAHMRLFLDAFLANQQIRLVLHDNGGMIKTKDDNDKRRDILFFGAMMCQIALHQTLDLGGTLPRRSVRSVSQAEVPMSATKRAAVAGIPDSDFEHLKTLFAAELAGTDTTQLQDSFEFQEQLAGQVRKMAGFAPKPEESIPQSAIQSFEELVVQCCSVIPGNRPEATALEDWLAAIVDDVGGKSLSQADYKERDGILWVLQPKDTEMLGDVQTTDMSNLFNVTLLDPVDESLSSPPSPAPAGAGGRVGAGAGGYESEDSFNPQDNTDPDAVKRERRPSRLMQFIESTPSPSETSTVKLRDNDSTGSSNHGGADGPPPQRKKSVHDEWASKKDGVSAKAKKRMSLAPTSNAMMRFASKMLDRKASGGTHITPEYCQERFDKQDRLSDADVMSLLDQAERLLKHEPNIPTMEAPVTVVGDLHGQYYDLIHMLTVAGSPNKVKYLFLGDYVDRGDWSCEVLFYLLSVKVAHPDTVTLIRGNHECDAVASFFGFKEECERKYGRSVFYKCLQVFQAMPIACLLETGGAGRFLCVHGGISPNVTTLEQFERIDRIAEPGMNGFLCDVLWADPIKDEFDDGQHDKLGDFLSIDYVSNPARGCSFRFGYSAIVSFLATNRLAAIIRAHEVMQEGFLYHFQAITGGGKARIMPPVITVFSAPNYLGKYGNKGAFLQISSAAHGVKAGFKPMDLLRPVQFDAVPHPDPLVLESETEKQQARIDSTCPYMPSTFETFVHTALAFGMDLDEDGTGGGGGGGDGDDNEKSIFEVAAQDRIPAMMKTRKSSLDRIAAEARQASAASLTPQQQAAVDMNYIDLLKGGLLKDAGNKTARRNSIMALKEKKGVSGLVAKFSQAAAVDGINELHPELVKAKMNQAKQKLAAEAAVPQKAPAASAPQKTAATVPAVPILSATAHTGRRTVVNNKRGVVRADGKSWIKEKKDADDKPQRQGLLNQRGPIHLPSSGGSSAATGGGGGSAAEPAEIEFDPDEILSLQMLYLMIDRDGDGGITQKELEQWSAMDGSTVSPEDAKLVIEALDLDEDGKVGFADYLSFAAALKQKYLREQQKKKKGTGGGR